jgi:glutathionylspermidine synthase
MEKEPKIEQSETISVSEALDKLRRATDILREMGLEVIDRFITDDKIASEMPFPIVRDRVDGIRATFSKRRGLKIWFTNGFEDPNDPERQKIEKRLKEAGLE